MELSFLFMQPLPARLARSEAIKLVRQILQAPFVTILIAVSAATKNDTLTCTDALDFELEDLVNACTFLITKGDLILPQTETNELEVLSILLLEAFNRRLHLLSELKQ